MALRRGAAARESRGQSAGALRPAGVPPPGTLPARNARHSQSRKPWHGKTGLAPSINSGAFISIGLVGEKKFTDSTIPAEALTASYTVTPQRGQQIGATSGIFQVRFTPAAGVVRAQIASVKMAA